MAPQDDHKDEKSKGYIIQESENFNTAYFGNPPESEQPKINGKTHAQLIALLTDPNNKSQKDEILHVLKAGNAADVLVEMISDKAYTKHRLTLLAACWESGIDFSAYLIFFIRCAINGTYDECIEAMTVIEEMNGPFAETALREGLELIIPLCNEKEEKFSLYVSIRQKLENALHALTS